MEFVGQKQYLWEQERDRLVNELATAYYQQFYLALAQPTLPNQSEAVAAAYAAEADNSAASAASSANAAGASEAVSDGSGADAEAAGVPAEPLTPEQESEIIANTEVTLMNFEGLLTALIKEHAGRIQPCALLLDSYDAALTSVGDCPELIPPLQKLVEKMVFTSSLRGNAKPQKKSVLILGVNGFIGSAISERLLENGGYEVYGMDLRSNYISDLIGRPGFHFFEGDITINREWIEYHVRKCDIVLPLVAIATPIEYTRNPLRVFELDFEENLRIVRCCVKYGKRIIFPSTSEVYGMCTDESFDEDNSPLITGPIRMQRWIYSCSKQMLDRVIWAYGAKGQLKFTLFRPFNWMGPKLDSLSSARIGSSRAITQLILNLVQGTPIQLIDGGAQKRCFTHVTDGIECLFRIIENKDGRCDGKIINIGCPSNEASIRELAEELVRQFSKHPLRKKFPPFAGYKEVESSSFYGRGYQDVQHRKPSIRNAKKYCDWEPRVKLKDSINMTLDFFLRQAVESGEFTSK